MAVVQEGPRGRRSLFIKPGVLSILQQVATGPGQLHGLLLPLNGDYTVYDVLWSPSAVGPPSSSIILDSKTAGAGIWTGNVPFANGLLIVGATWMLVSFSQ